MSIFPFFGILEACYNYIYAKKIIDGQDYTENGTNETLKRCEAILHSGLLLIKNGENRKATYYFRDEEKARSLGIILSEGRSYAISQNPTDEEVSNTIENIASSCHCNVNPTTGRITLVLSRPFEVVFSKEKDALVEIILPEKIWRDTALVHAEEWVHVLQEIKGSNLTHVQDREQDVAVYFQQQGVPLTDAFLNRYNRKSL